MKGIYMNLDNIKAALFDLDGTLIDTEKYYIQCWKEASKLCGFEIEMDKVYMLRSCEYELGTELFYKWFNNKDAYRIVRTKRKELMNELLRSEKIEAKKGVKEVVDFFNKEGISVAVVTASAVDVADKYMKQAGIRDYFDTIISAKDVKRGKPFPYVYEFAAGYLGLKPSECIAFEDSPNGMKSAHDAGCHTVFIPDATPFDDTVSEYTDETYETLSEFVNKHN